ncbi:MAG: toll/interleukin-1 receptor domain-containing protein [Bryobacteraceae bacterium]
MRDYATMSDWLEKAGYRYLCYMSYQHNPVTADFVEHLTKAIRGELGLYFDNPQIVSSADQKPLESEWRDQTEQALTSSVSMIAVLAPTYFTSERCGREWAAMKRLSERRLVPSQSAILPVLFRGDGGDVRREIEMIDLSRVSLAGRYYRSMEFNRAVVSIGDAVLDKATYLFENGIRAGVPDFVFPEQSAFPHRTPEPVALRW